MADSDAWDKGAIIVLVSLVALPAVALSIVAARDRKGDIPPTKPPAITLQAAAPKQAALRRNMNEVTRTTWAPSADFTANKAEKAKKDPGAALVKKLARARSLELRDPKVARQILRDALRLDPQNEQALEDLAVKRLADEDSAEARQLADRCLAVNSDNQLCGKVSELAVLVTPVVEQLAKINEICLAADPENLECLSGKVSWLLLTGKAKEAELTSKRMAELDPDAVQSVLARARLESANGAYAEARQSFSMACELGIYQACDRSALLRTEGW